jgi:exopolyphosphatase/guanosine-5'-triphosphate,3'-diphosphate pyrophosphatase
MDENLTRLSGVIDIGTNSTRLLIASFEQGRLHIIRKASQITRLGRGVDSKRQLSSTAMQETLDVVLAYLAEARTAGAAQVSIIATSAVRDAANRHVFAELLCQATGHQLQILSGVEEAMLSYRGALSGFAVPPTAPMVADVGGGSTELVMGDKLAVSLDIGAVRLTERFLRSNPVTVAEASDARSYVHQQLKTLGDQLLRPQCLVGLGGTITCLGGVVAAIPVYDSAVVHMSRIDQARLESIIENLAALDIAQRREIIGMQPGREDIILGGALIFQCLLQAFNLGEIIVCDADIMEGVLLSEMEIH